MGVRDGAISVMLATSSEGAAGSNNVDVTFVKIGNEVGLVAAECGACYRLPRYDVSIDSEVVFIADVVVVMVNVDVETNGSIVMVGDVGNGGI